MKQNRLYPWTWFLMVIIGFVLAAAPALAAEVPRISKEELKPLMDQAKATVIDVRRDGDWESSNQKIEGALREDPGGIPWASKYDKDQLLVLYCA